MNYDAEPMVRLSTGVRVMQAVFDSVTRLQALGHMIEVEDEQVTIDPPVPHDCWFMLDSNWKQTAAVLEADTAGSIH